MQFNTIILTIICLILAYNSTCQEIQGMLDWNEIYGLRIEFKDKLLTSKESCGIGDLKSKRNTLYKIEVKKIIFSRDSTVFNNKELLNVRYVVIPEDFEIALNYEYDILAGVSSSNKYIVGYNIFFTGIIQNLIYSPVTRPFLEKCPCNTQGFNILFKLKREPTYRNEEENNEFIQMIYLYSEKHNIPLSN